MKEAAPLLSNADLEKLARGILRLNKDRQFAVYERFVFIRGTYEKELERLVAQVAELEAELVQALDAAIMLGEHVEMWSDAACDRDNARRARYRELTGRGWDEEDAANE